MVERIYDWHYQARTLSAQRDAARARGAAALGADRGVPSGRGRGRPRRRSRARHVSRAVEARVPFELVHEAFLTPDRLDRFKLLILADAAALSEAQCAAIREYVDRGGSVAGDVRVIALRRARRPARATSVWRTCSACRSAGRIDGPMQNSYLSLEPDPATGKRHRDPRWSRRHAADHQRRVPPPCAADAGLSVTADADSVYPDLPMEDVYPRVRAHRHARGLSARPRPRPRRLLPVGYRSHVLGCPVRRSSAAAAKHDRMGTQRTRTGGGHGPGRPRRHRLAPARTR